MTDTSFSVKPINGPELSHASLAAAYQSHRNPLYHAPAQPDIPDDDGQISCICGYSDDDGWTVACDLCNRWQHQICYYPEYDERTLPEELQHHCIECRPRDNINIELARQRQRAKRKHPEPLPNGVKRPGAKSHKKKVKEPAASLPNGLHEKFRHDRNSASPRDQQPPPAKRPKTAHRTSDSTTTTSTKGSNRKRAASILNGHRRSLSRSPDSPVELYSEEFLQCYNDGYRETDSNLHNSIAVTNSLSAWLNASEEAFRDEHNQAKGEVLMRWDGKIEDIPGKAQTQIIASQDTSVQYNGRNPAWQTVTVKETVASGAYIGELKGHVGFKDDYQHDSSNRWEQLRHPEPFVFFHPKLPIVIDARHEGTELRFVRRSCVPNARLQVLVTDGADYHFCFMATQQIEPGEEIAVGWDTGDGLPELASRTAYSNDELEHLSSWVSTALANCGPCACPLPDEDCMMSRFDRRVKGGTDVHSAKALKSKKRKMGSHVSPINTHPFNSRSGSEARKIDQDDDSESRSTSGSAGRGSASRDITPNTHYSSNGHPYAIPELSERERKKLAKEEEIFRRQEEEQAGKQAKKKRSSAGSALATPSASTSKQLGQPTSSSSKYVDASSTRQTSLPSGKTAINRKGKTSKFQTRPSARVVRRPKPVYVDSAVQCDLDQEEALRRAAMPRPQRTYKTTKDRLLEICARNNAAVMPLRPSSNLSTSTEETAASIGIASEPNVALKPEPHSPSELRTSMDNVPALGEASSAAPAECEVEMEDASMSDDRKAEQPVSAQEPSSSSLTEHEDSAKSAALTDSAATLQLQELVAPRKSPDMHLHMPPPNINGFSRSTVPLPGGASVMTPGSTVQSPAALGPSSFLSPPVTAEKVLSTQKTKKLSLSDYAARRKAAKDKDNESKTDRESSPASVASGPIVPPVQASSSAEAMAAQGGSAIEEDVVMEDAGGSTEAVPAA